MPAQNLQPEMENISTCPRNTILDCFAVGLEVNLIVVGKGGTGYEVTRLPWDVISHMTFHFTLQVNPTTNFACVYSSKHE